MKIFMLKTMLLLQLVLLSNCSLLKWEFNDSITPNQSERALSKKDKVPEFIANFVAIIQEGLETANKNGGDLPEIILDVPGEIDREFEIPVKQGDNQVGTITGKEDTESDNSQSIKVAFINPVDESDLVLSKIDPKDEKDEILQKYVVPYLTHCKEIVRETTEVEKIIEAQIPEVQNQIKALNENREKGYKKLFSIQPHELNEDKPNEVELVYSLKDDDRQYSYIVKVVIEKSEKEDSDDIIVKFRSPFFSSQFAVTVPTKTFIENKTRNILLHISKNFSRMFVFTVNPEMGADQEENEEPVFTCERLKDTLKQIDIVDFKLVFENEEEGLLDVKPVNDQNEEQESCPEDGKEFKIQCEEAVEIDQSNDILGDLSHDLIYVRITVDTKKFVQTFAKKSLYSMEPVAEAFFEEVGDYAGKTFCPKVEDNSKAFNDEADEPVQAQAASDNKDDEE